MPKRILIVEDEVRLARLLELELNMQGYVSTCALDGSSGLALALNKPFDLILLDVMLPGVSGFEICRQVRKVSSVPILMLTARGDTVDKVKGLDCGADDYISKPFEMAELAARIRSALRRFSSVPAAPANRLVHGDLVIDEDTHEISFRGERVECTKREYDLLRYLALHEGKALTREQLLEDVWEYQYYTDTNVVDVYVRYLRAKIDDKYRVKLIHTIRGVGYLFKSQ